MDPGPVARWIAGAAMIDRWSVVDVVEAIGEVRIVPVVTTDNAEQAPALVSALLDGGLSAVEITLRTAAGIEAIRNVTAAAPTAIVGAGSVTSAAAASAAIDAGARFIVSPGLDDGVITTAQRRGIPVIPGVATATELMRATQLGVDVVKLFPAEVVGGAGMITALSAVWPDVRFMPTGGITPENACAYLGLRQVLAVGGSWMVPRAAVDAADWASITTAAEAALELTRELA